MLMYFRHLDNQGLWVPNTFAVHAFRAIMFSIQAQHCYLVAQAIMTHLDNNQAINPKVKASIADVLSQIITIAARESVGKSYHCSMLS